MNRSPTRTRTRKSRPVKNNIPNSKVSNKENKAPKTNKKEDAVKPGMKRKKSSETPKLPSGWIRNYHPDFDPVIEIRRAKERYQMYKSNDWNASSDLCDEEMADLEKYKSKLRSRDRKDLQTENKIEELRRRQKDIDMSKIADIYAKYIYEVPKPVRLDHHPKTPNKFLKMSRNKWDGLVKKWRKHLHNYQDSSFSSSSHVSSRSSFSGTSTEFSFSLEDELPECKFEFDILPLDEDEDTLQGTTTTKQRTSGGLQDVLHSGLSNDLTSINVQYKSEEEAICSPFKRSKMDKH